MIQKFPSNNHEVVSNSLDMKIGKMHFVNREYGDALKHYRKMQVRCPFSASVYNQLAHVALRTKGNQEAFRYIQKCLLLDPDFVHGKETLGHIYYKMGYYEKSLDVYQDLLARDANVVSYHCGLGHALFALNRYADAAIEFSICTQIMPNQFLYWHWLTLCYEELGELDTAFKIRKWLYSQIPSGLEVDRFAIDETEEPG